MNTLLQDFYGKTQTSGRRSLYWKKWNLPRFRDYKREHIEEIDLFQMYNFDPSPVWSIFSLLIRWNQTGGTWRPFSEWVAIFEFVKFSSLCVWFWFHDSMTYVLFLTLILWSKGDLFIHLQWCSLKERNHSHQDRVQKPVFAPSNFFSEVALPFDQNLSMVTQDNTPFSHAIWNTMSTYDIDAWQNNCWNYVTDINTQCTFSSILVWLQKMK